MFWLPVSELSAMLSCYAPGRRDSRQRGHSRRKLLTLDRQGIEQERTRKNRSETESRKGKEKESGTRQTLQGTRSEIYFLQSGITS